MMPTPEEIRQALDVLGIDAAWVRADDIGGSTGAVDLIMGALSAAVWEIDTEAARCAQT